MRILQKTEDVLTLQNPAGDFWFGKIYLLFGCPLLMVGLAMSGGGWWRLPLFFVLAGFFWLALDLTWASDVVNVCSFNKTLGKVTVKYQGLHQTYKDFPLQDFQTVEVRKTTGFIYGTTVERYQLWLVTKRFYKIALSEEYSIGASLETIANQVREFLSLSNRSI